jgi:hypothetical protein
MDFLFYLEIFKTIKKMAQELRDATRRLLEIEAQLTELNEQRRLLLRSRHDVESEITLIVKEPAYNDVQQIEAGGRTIKIIREFNKPWSLSKYVLRSLVHEHFQDRPLLASPLLDFIYREVYRMNHSTQMKIELQ